MDPRDAYKSFECAECMQYQQTAPLTQVAQDIIQSLGQLDYEASVSSTQEQASNEPQSELATEREHEGAQLVTGRGKGKVHSVPFVIVKIEEFVGTLIVTVDFFGKVTSKGATLGVVTLGASAVPGAVGAKQQKATAKEHLVVLWQALASKLGAGTLVASTLNPDQSHNPITFNPQNLDVTTDANVHDIEPFVYDPKQKGGMYDHIAHAGTAASIGTNAIKIGAKTGEIVLGTAAGMTSFFPLIGVGFASAKLKTAKNKAQKDQAIGQLVGTLTFIPLAGFVGGQIGKAIGKQSDKKLTKFEVVENELLQKKKDALALAGVHPKEKEEPAEQEQKKHFYDRFNFFKRRQSRESLDGSSGYRPEGSQYSAEQGSQQATQAGAPPPHQPQGTDSPQTTDNTPTPVISLRKDYVNHEEASSSPQSQNNGETPVISLRKDYVSESH